MALPDRIPDLVDFAAIVAINAVIAGTEFEGDVFAVGGAVRDSLLSAAISTDIDLVTRGSAEALAGRLWKAGAAAHFPVVFERFGTAMVRVGDSEVEIVTARKESYDRRSRKPTVTTGTYLEDAQRRDFTINTLLADIRDGRVIDPLGTGRADLEARILRTPLEPRQTFRDDPLRMLRAVRFRWRFGLTPAEGLYEAIASERDRLRILSWERIRDELLKMLSLPNAPAALNDLMALRLFDTIAPEFGPMVGEEQGHYHHLDVWDHSRLVLQNLIGQGVEDPDVRLAALLHDVGKPPTRLIDEKGAIRYFGHESVGAEMATEILRRWKLPERRVQRVARLVKNHMRLGSSPRFTPSAARRVVRDMGSDTESLLNLVEADVHALAPGVEPMDIRAIRDQIGRVRVEEPTGGFESPLSGAEIMAIAEIDAGPEVGRLKAALRQRVLDGELAAGDREAAATTLKQILGRSE